MSATFTKITGGWGVKVPHDDLLRGIGTGDEVVVVTRRGGQRKVKLGVAGEPDRYGDVTFAIDEKPQARWGQTRDGWCVKVPEVIAKTVKTGTVIEVFKANGESQTVTLGEFKGSWQGYDYYARAEVDGASFAGAENKGTPITEPGAFEYGGHVYIVKHNRAKTNLYAQKVVEAPSDRLNQKDERVPIELEYERGAMAFLREEHRLDADRAKELTIRYGRCIVCGKRLKVAESLERGIGPVCWKRVKHGAAA
jgi:hypothetical protein